jgi:hypothetical protein
MLCPICDHNISRVQSSPLYIKDRVCQRCGTLWTPAYGRLSIAIFAILCLASSVLVMFLDDRMYIHGNMNAVSSDNKPIALAGALFALAAGVWGLLHLLFLIRTPAVQILRAGVWPPSPVAPQSEGTVVQADLKSDEVRGADEGKPVSPKQKTGSQSNALKIALFTLFLGGVIFASLPRGLNRNGLATGGDNTSVSKPAAGGETLKPLIGGKEYSSEVAHYSISFPQSWTIKPGDNPNVPGLVTGWLKPEEGATVGASVAVFPGSMDPPMSAADAMARYLDGMKKEGTEKTEEHHGEVNGRPATWLVINFKSDAEPRRGIVLGTTEGNTAYIVTCSTLPEKFDSVRPTFESILGTFRVTK